MVRTAGSVQQIEASPEDVGLSSQGMARLTSPRPGLHRRRQVPRRDLDGAAPRQGRALRDLRPARLEAGKPIERDTIFRIYSMTKPIVSVGLMTLYEEGLFQLDDPVSKYIPQFKGLKVFAGGTPDAPQLREPSREMTVADLLRHTSGLVAKTDAVLWRRLPRAWACVTSASSGTLADMVEKLGSLPLKCDPGSEWNYGISTDVVGYLCEVLSGQRLDDFLRRAHPAARWAWSTPASRCRRRTSSASPPTTARGEAGAPLLVARRPRRTRRAATRSRAPISPAPAAWSRPRPTTCASARCWPTAASWTARGSSARARCEFMALNHLPGGRDLAPMSNGSAGETSRDGVGFGLGFARGAGPDGARRAQRRRASTTGAAPPRRRSWSRRRRTWPWCS